MSIDLDFDREERQGFPEVIYGEGKSVDQLIEIAKQYQGREKPFLVTRLDLEKTEALQNYLNQGQQVFSSESKTFAWYPEGFEQKMKKGIVNLLCAGTSDVPVLAEAEATLMFHGIECVRVCDVGVAGIHRLLKHRDQLQKADINIVVAGMEGALPSVVGGLVGTPIIAVPTSIGYGANFAGVSALLTMINSCASGITVVNIDNGFGAAMAAIRILNMIKE